MIEIIPKKAPSLPILLNFLFYFSLILLTAVIIAIFVFNGSVKNSKEVLAELEKSLESSKTSERIDLENEVLNFQKKIKDFSQLINQHLETSKIFEVLQRNCHPKVWFSQFNLDAKESKVSVSGETQNFESLGQQLLIFQDENLIKKVNLEQALITKEGKIKFSLILFLDPQIFKIE